MSKIKDAADAISKARSATRRGALSEAERWSLIAERLAAAEAASGDGPPLDLDSWADEEAACAELRRRLQLYCEADLMFQVWEAERDAYYEALAAALANNLDPPPPLRPNPAGEIGEREYLRRIAMEGRAG